MKNKISLSVAGLLLIAYGLPAQADSFLQLWDCELHDGKTPADLIKVSSEWTKAMKKIDGTKAFEVYVEFPVSSGNLDAFTFVLEVDSLANWGTYEDAYAGSQAAKVDEAWNQVATCKSSSLWNSTKIE